MAGSIRSLLRSIVPNSDPHVSLIRIYSDWTETLPIVAWDVHILAIIPDGQTHPRDHIEVTPISIEEKSDNAWECIISGTRVYNFGQSWDSVAEAVSDCQARLRSGEK